MASLKAIRKRITSVRNTQKVTRAMQMIAAARLRKAQMAAVGARAYAAHVREMAVRIAARSGAEVHPFVAPSASTAVELVVITSDRGLCGGFNENLLRQVADRWKQLAATGTAVTATVIGRKGRDVLKAKGCVAREVHVGLGDRPPIERIVAIAEGLAARFLSGAIGQLQVCYNRFRSALIHDVTMETLLPMAETAEPMTPACGIDYLYEPSREVVVERILTRALGARLYQAMLESVASEFAARMTAMDSATKNAADMIQVLTMQLNRARQAAITKELMDIVNGAESLRR